MGKITRKMLAVKTSWKNLSPAEKAHLILDVICGLGMGCINFEVDRKLMAGKGPITKILIGLTTAGLSIVAGDMAVTGLEEAYVLPILDKVQKEKEKEAKANA